MIIFKCQLWVYNFHSKVQQPWFLLLRLCEQKENQPIFTDYSCPEALQLCILHSILIIKINNFVKQFQENVLEMLPVPVHQISVLTLIMLNINGERTIQPKTAKTLRYITYQKLHLVIQSSFEHVLARPHMVLLDPPPSEESNPPLLYHSRLGQIQTK